MAETKIIAHVQQVATPTDFQSRVMGTLGVPPCERYLTHLSSLG